MDLILWRHAEAEEAHNGLDDAERSLTAKGERQARRMACWLDQHLPESTRILVSPARRTEQTALLLGRKYKLREELAPDVDVGDVLDMLKLSDKKAANGKGHTLIVGHQPYLGQMIAQLLGMPVEACAVRKGSAWWLRLRQRDGVLQALLVAAHAPEVASATWELSDEAI
jgi:phosphohistidine phosphatase